MFGIYAPSFMYEATLLEVHESELTVDDATRLPGRSVQALLHPA